MSSQFGSMICSDLLCNTSEIVSVSLFSFIRNSSLQIGVTVRGHFASNPAYPCQASSSVFNCFPNWLGFMVRRVDVYSRYFSQLEEAGTSAISIIDIPERKRALAWRLLLFHQGGVLCFSSPIRCRSLLLSFLPRTMRSFPIFFGYFPREESSSLGRNFQDSRSCVLCRLFEFSGQITIFCIDYVGHSPSVKAG